MNKFNFGKIAELMPLLSISLIFIGYCHLHFYYQTHFDIEIYQYISTGEIILSFLPVAKSLFITGIVVGFFTVLIEGEALANINRAPQKETKSGQKSGFLPLSVYNRFLSKHKSKLKFKQKLSIYLKILFNIRILALVFLIWVTYKACTTQFGDDVVIGVFLAIIWVVITFNYLRRRFYLLISHHFKSSNYKLAYITLLLFVGFILVDAIISNYDAEEVKSGKSSNAISLTYENKRIDTFQDTILSYIGSTQQYVFIYNKKDKRNYIYNKEQMIDVVSGLKEKPSKKTK